MTDLGKWLIFVGVFFIVFGLVLLLVLLVEKLPFGFGKLPGDILIKRDNFTFYFPLATSLLISLLLTLILSLIFWLLRK
jgi:uncharacterized protein HemY